MRKAYPRLGGRIFRAALNRATLSYARRAKKARPTGRRPGRDSALRSVVGSQVNRWAVAADQELAKSGMHLYWVYQHFDSPDLDLIDKNLNHRSVPLDAFDLFYTGARIYF